MNYDGPERRKTSMDKTIAEIHDTLIRLEPFCEKVAKHDKVLYNDGWGLITQCRILWLISGGLWAIILIWVKNTI